MDYDNSEALDARDRLPADAVQPSMRSAWGALARGAGEGIAQFAEQIAKVQQATNPANRKGRFGETADYRATMDELAAQEEQRIRRIGDWGRSLRPDPTTASTAEQIVHGMSRGLTKAAGAVLGLGPVAGAAAFGGSEAGVTYGDLRRDGVDPTTAGTAAAVAGVVNAAGVLLPLSGPTLKATAALYAVGGPGAFMAQQKLTSDILQMADYGELAKRYDPLDPMGLALSALVPLPFAGYGAVRSIRSAKAKAGAPAPVPAAVPAETVDAAMAHNLTLQADRMDTAGPADIAAAMRPPEPAAVAELFDPAAPFADLPTTPRAVPTVQELATDLRAMGQMAYWAQEGGRMIRDGQAAAGDQSAGGAVVGRTPWIPAEEWFGRMRSELGKGGLSAQADIQAAIEAAIAGQKLNAKQARTVEWLHKEAADMRDTLARTEFAPTDADALALDALNAGLSARDAPDLAATARAVEIDADAVERAAIQFENDDAGFIQAIRKIINDGQAQAAAQPGANAGARGAAAPAANAAPAAKEALAPHWQAAARLMRGESAGPQDGAAVAATVQRAQALEATNPAAAEEMAAARKLAAEGTDTELGALDADLLRVAIECELSTGAV